ncbi:ABC transporter ATP-binding protein [Micromonospora sp. WMMD718]|uniref:ABC transporter ATP-binding protein n=1 Tax=Micromonospora TaxID=1873 RepID=UPI0001BF4F73|nr:MULTISPECIES: ABC transporter ATP-binding protein [Micromonospora]ADL48894.1 oligopeptide/dipeptide ABC transporter, ATPase subunit [Micromonospora aurantiaca ATCC 27029]MDG4754181.1 ABC transporter ATP-binding protein [Micromonospora sp. WMMD718]OHX05736.1 methionine ABC transporter ATP-binding protein [Micromonospora sp. WMMB235]SCL41379.1 peptide/nickel transport system ATP-binding protein [Micromonospora aurantiaca]
MTQNAVRPTPASPTPPGGHLLEVRDLHVEFRTREGVARVINGVTYHLDAGETLAVLGESGSGKSVTAQAIMGILDTPPAYVRAGQILYQGRDLLTRPEEERRQIRGAEIAMIFQDALSALNPVFPVGWQIGESLRERAGMSRADARRRTVELMDLVRIPAAAKRLGDYPHQFSGGMRQRVMIAMALALDPKVLIADEPTTALDVTVQAQIMDLLADLRRDLGMALVLITHDLGVVAGVADRIAVMYAGRIVEHADVHALYRAPAHPYTKGLLESIPRLDVRGQALSSIRGLPPNLMAIPSGCPFHPRCPYVQPVCVDEVPHDLVLGDGRTSACHFAQEVHDDRDG